MQKRELKDLNLLDDFLFGSMVTHPEAGKPFVRRLLRTIFGKEFGALTVVPQKIYYGSDTGLHGTRLDVYLEENSSTGTDNDTEQATVYDVEPDQTPNPEDRSALPRRVRFYHAKIDAKALKSGEKYQKLKKVVVVMITPYDPFGLNRMIYTIRSHCSEVPDMPYDDGASTLFLYTRGIMGNPPEELRQFLRYMENTKEENITNENIRSIHQLVKLVKQDEEVSLEYMKIFEREQMLIEQGIQQGIRQSQAALEQERLRADQASQKAAQASQRADQASQRADQASQRADQASQEAAQERQRAENAEREVERLKAALEKAKKNNKS